MISRFAADLFQLLVCFLRIAQHQPPLRGLNLEAFCLCQSVHAIPSLLPYLPSFRASLSHSANHSALFHSFIGTSFFMPQTSLQIFLQTTETSMRIRQGSP